MFSAITQSLKYLPGVVASVNKFSTKTAQAFLRQASNVIREDESLSAPVLSLLLMVITRMMEHRSDLLLESERAHRSMLRKLKRLRVRRDDEAQNLYQTLLNVRATFEGAHGKGTSADFLGLDPGMGAVSTPVLLRHAHEAVDELSKPNFELPDTTLASTVTSPLEYGKEIQEPLAALEATLKILEEQKRDTEEAMRVKNQTLEESHKVIIHGSRIIEGIYTLAGEEFHGARLRGLVGSRTPSDGEPLDFLGLEDPDVPDGQQPPAAEGESVEGPSA